MWRREDEMTAATLDAFLNSYSRDGDPLKPAVAATVRQPGGGGRSRSATPSTRACSAPPSPAPAAPMPTATSRRSSTSSPTTSSSMPCARRRSALYASEELDSPVLLDPAAPLAIAIDPLDGSSNIETNVSIGTIFSILPATGAPGDNPAAPFLQAGMQVSSAPASSSTGRSSRLVLSLGSGTHVLRALDPARHFRAGL